MEKVRSAYKEKEKIIGPELMRELERMILLHAVDSQWKGHLYDMDHLKEGIGLRGYAQRDPLIEYKREAYNMFEDIIQRIREEVAEFVFKVEVVRTSSSIKTPSRPEVVLAGTNPTGRDSFFSSERETSPGRVKSKIGRNNPCPCGSGKKYKYCCGKS